MDILYSIPFIVVLILLVLAFLADRKRFEKEQYVSSHDSLTGLYNREVFFAKAEELVRKNPKKKMCMVCTNIKNFKLTNDLFGNEMGDRVLADQARLLMLADYDNCIHGRIAGDKFAMLIPKENFNPELAVENTSKLQYCINDTNYKLHIAIGVYEIENVNESAQVMCDKANMAIESLKDEYGKGVVYYNDKMLDRLVNEKNVLSEFDHAIEQKQFKMYLQPQVSVDGTLMGAEAIVRWHHPKLGVLMPSEFIDIIESRGFIYKLDRYMWEQAAMKLGEWKKQGLTDIPISVNVSTKDFYYTDLYRTFTGLVEKYDIQPQVLNIEITETVFMDDVRTNIGIVNKLREYGFHVEIDDFGSGYSSLNLLKDIEADIIKIDMAFLGETDNTPKSLTIIKSIISMAKELGMTVITEGVSTKAQVDFLREVGCDICQGYYFSKPILISDFEEKYNIKPNII